MSNLGSSATSPINARNAVGESASAPDSARLPIQNSVNGANAAGTRLADFILREMEPILAEWDAFAATRQPAAGQMDTLSLRDHAKEILRAIAMDLRQDQSAHEQDLKAKGRSPLEMNATATAAETHAVLRAKCGFDVVQMASEYRALRASVLRLWAAACHQGAFVCATDIQDAGRFHEAIDQALMESITVFTQEAERRRGLFVGVVGHDLRNPMMTILASTQYLSKLVLPGNGSEAVDRINRASRRMRQLLDDLSDYNLATLTKFIPVTFSEVDLAKLCTFEIADLRSAYEGRNVVFRGEGDLNGVWDPVRLQQLLSNLLKNAIDYGAPEKDIEVSASGTGDEVTVSVLNRGKPIPPDIKARIFEPLVRGDSAERPTHGNLGLGLFIAREIAHAHHGALHVRSDSQATVFTIQMPRNSRAALGLSQ